MHISDSSGVDGLVLVDKPSVWTSHDVVARLRRMFGTRKVGHAGTLDPMATGLLIVGVNRGTKLLTYLVGLPKEYSATIRLGVQTVTEDAEGDITAVASRASIDAVDVASIDSAIAALRGEIHQVPSSVSAIKVDGVRSYSRVRAGENVQLASRPVTISRFERVGEPRQAHTLDGAPVVDVDVWVGCSSGTYVRALARDVGAILGVGGHLTALRRHTVGPFSVEAAYTLAPRSAAWPEADEHPFSLLTLAEAASAVFPVRELSFVESVAVNDGKRLSPSGVEGTVVALGPSGGFAALLNDVHDQARPLYVLRDSTLKDTNPPHGEMSHGGAAE